MFVVDIFEVVRWKKAHTIEKKFVGGLKLIKSWSLYFQELFDF